MYAAAGGASLASRSRQRQRQQNNQKKALQAKLAHEVKARGVATPTRSQPSRQFHQLPSTYLRTPQAEARKLSAGYATQSKLLLPIVEGNSQQQHQHHHQHPHHHHHHQQHDLHGRPLSPKFGPRHGRLQHLTKSATATLPLVSHAEATPPTTPIGIRESGPNLPSQSGHIPIPQHDSIIITPATPVASPGHTAVETVTSGGPLERKCSFYRVRRSDAFEHDDYPDYTAAPAHTTITTAQHQVDYTDENYAYGLPNGGSGHKWAAQTTYSEQDICSCEHIECAQGRAAWLERGRRCSVQDNNPASCHRRWVKRNRIQDSSLGGSSDDEDLLGVLRGPSSFANAFLYVGLGTIAIGLVIAFVGTGEKGFKTVELRLIGPSLIGIGLICCILRICFCICPSHCLSSSRRVRKKNSNKVDADHTTSLLRGESKRVSIAKGPHLQKFPLTHKKSNNKMLNEGMEALRQIATTSLFLQNEQKPSTNRVVPIIKEPEKPTEPPLEMKKLEAPLNICDISDDEDEEEEAGPGYSNQTDSLVQSQSKLARQRVPINQQQQQQQHQMLNQQTDSESLLMETSLMVINPPPSTSAMSTIVPSSSHSYDMPSPTPHQYPRIEQHTPGQVVDTSSQSLQLPSAFTPSLLGSSSQSHPTSGLLTVNNSTSTALSIPSQSQSPHTLSLPPAITSEAELVLSPAKLGQ